MRASRLAALSLLVWVQLLSGVGTASAEVVGTVSFVPVAGQDVHPMSAFTSGKCPGGTHLIVKIYGHGFPSTGINGTSNSAIGIYHKGSNGGIEIPLLQTFRTFADAQHPSVVLQGKYDVVVTCKLLTGSQTFGEFKGSLTFTSQTEYTSGDGKTPAASRVPVPEGDSQISAPRNQSSLNASPAAATGGSSSKSSPALVAVGGLLAVVVVGALSFSLGRRKPRI